MLDVSEEIYTQNFEKIFDWFQQNVHHAPDEFDYQINDLGGTHLKLVDIVRKSTGGLYFRVILKATYDNVEQVAVPQKNYEDLAYLFNTKTKNEFIPGTSTQVCYVQLNEENIPINGILYTYSSEDEKYHEFKLPE
jgi:hypothetical protein